MQGLKYRYIAIEGNIGAGKTTVAKKLHDALGARLILETFSNNPFLPNFYKDPQRYGFNVELFFMAERHRQLTEYVDGPNLFGEPIVSDFIFWKTLLFANHTLVDHELDLFKKIFHGLNRTFPEPDLLIYLHASPNHLLKNIKKRGRNYEQEIQPEYLQRIQDSYWTYMKTVDSFPVLILDVEKLDLVRSEKDFQKLIKLLGENHKVGLNTFTF